MKKLSEQQLSGAYAISMSAVFLLAFGPKGYENICEVKWAVFCSLTALYAAAMAVLWMRDRRCPLLRPTVPEACMTAYFLLTLLSALCSPWRETALTGGGRYDGALTALLYVFLALSLSRTAEPGRLLLRVFAAALTVYCAVCLLQLADRNPLGLYPDGLRWSGRESEYNGAFLGFTGNADLSAAVLCMGFCICLSGALTAGERWLLLPAAAAAAVLLLSGMRGGILGAAGGMLLTLPGTLGWRRQRLCVWWGCLTAAAALLLFLVWLLPLRGTAGELHTLLHGSLPDVFGSGRGYIWKHVLPMVKERPLLGGGADTLGLRAGLEFAKPLPDGGVLRRSIDCAHSEYLNILVNQGLPALLCLLFGAGYSMVRSRDGGPAAHILRAGIAAYAVQALTGISMPGSTAFFWLCWGLLVAAMRRGRR